MDIRKRTQELLKALTDDAYERSEVMALSLLSALAGESIFLLGLPGVGKSMMARKLKLAFQGANSFEYLMSRFSTPDEIFGPISITKLREQDTYQRITKGYLPESEIIFLDEIWKAGPAIQNSLLTVLNEKIYRNGDFDMYLPIRGIIAASNELPAEGEGLEALWDRFLIRYVVEPIKIKNNFNRLISSNRSATKSQEIVPFTQKECQQLDALVSKCEIPEYIMELMYQLREDLTELSKSEADDTSNENNTEMKYYVSDRRWCKIAHVMRVSACVNGRNVVDISDFMLLVHMIWNSDECINKCRNTVIRCAVYYCLRDFIVKNRSISKFKKSPKKLVVQNGTHYFVDCNGYSFRIKISDYEYMAANPKEMFYAVESNDDELIISDRGPYVLQVYKKDYLCVNSYNSPLRIKGGPFVSDSLTDGINSFDDVYDSFVRALTDNIFVTDSNIFNLIRGYFFELKDKIKNTKR